jgi:AcrR family transcriptional regulator
VNFEATDPDMAPVRPGKPRVTHAEQKTRTRAALVTTCRDLVRSGSEVSMPTIAHLAHVSEATAYRHFPDLVSLINEALRELWPPPAQALQPVQKSTDPIERIGFACEFVLRRSYAYQGAVRAAIAATITRPHTVKNRPGFRFGLINAALDPVLVPTDTPTATRIAQLKTDLAAILSAEGLFTLTDLAELAPDDAIASLRRTAETLTRVALTDIARTKSRT